MSEPAIQPTAEAARLPDILPVLPLKDVVIFPFIIVPLSVGRDKSVRAVDQALAEHRMLMLLTQKSPLLDDPGEDDLPRLGTAASIMRMLKLPDGRIRILVQGISRARVEHFSQSEPFLVAKVEPVEERAPAESTLEIEALMRSVKENLERAVNLGKSISPEVMVIAANLDDPGRLADLAASNLDLKVAEAQEILETISPFERLERVSELLLRELELLTMQQEISIAGARRDGQEPARVLPAPAAQGHPGGARRGRRAGRGDRRLPPAGAGAQPHPRRRARSSSGRSAGSSAGTPTAPRAR